MGTLERIDLPLIPVDVDLTGLPPEMFEQAQSIAALAGQPEDQQRVAWQYAHEQQPAERRPTLINALGGIDIDGEPERRERAGQYLVVRNIIVHNAEVDEANGFISTGLFHPAVSRLMGEAFEAYTRAVRAKLNSFALLPRHARQQHGPEVIDSAIETSQDFIAAYSGKVLIALEVEAEAA